MMRYRAMNHVPWDITFLEWRYGEQLVIGIRSGCVSWIETWTLESREPLRQFLAYIEDQTADRQLLHRVIEAYRQP